jgi:hypothetical protein
MVGGEWKLTGMGMGDEFRYFIVSGKVFESNALPTYSVLLENRVFGDVPLCRWVGHFF